MGPADHTKPTMKKPLVGPAALAQVVSAWNRAGATWDATALAAVYTDDGLLFGGRPGHAVGREAIRGYFASYDGVILSGSMQLSETELRLMGEGSLLAQGMVHFAFTLAGGEQTRSTMRATLLLQRGVGGWRILDHHFSTIPLVPPLGKE